MHYASACVTKTELSHKTVDFGGETGERSSVWRPPCQSHQWEMQTLTRSQRPSSETARRRQERSEQSPETPTAQSRLRHGLVTQRRRTCNCTLPMVHHTVDECHRRVGGGFPALKLPFHLFASSPEILQTSSPSFFHAGSNPPLPFYLTQNDTTLRLESSGDPNNGTENQQIVH